MTDVCAQVLGPGLAAYQRLSDAGELCSLAGFDDALATACRAASGEARNRALARADQKILCAVLCCCAANPVAQAGGRRGYDQCATETLGAAQRALGNNARYKPQVSYNMRANPPEPLMDKNLFGQLTTRPLDFPSEYGRMTGRIQRDFPGVTAEGGTDTRRPDVVIVRDPSRPPTADNISRVVDFKFPGDQVREAADRAYTEIGGGVPPLELNVRVCGCSDDDEKRRQVELVSAAEQAYAVRRSNLERLGWGALGVIGVGVTALAILSPFEGPAGDIAAGAGTAAAWSRALGGAATLARSRAAMQSAAAAWNRLYAPGF